eukprot:gene2185-7956_t
MVAFGYCRDCAEQLGSGLQELAIRPVCGRCGEETVILEDASAEVGAGAAGSEPFVTCYNGDCPGAERHRCKYQVKCKGERPHDGREICGAVGVAVLRDIAVAPASAECGSCMGTELGRAVRMGGCGCWWCIDCFVRHVRTQIMGREGALLQGPYGKWFFGCANKCEGAYLRGLQVMKLAGHESGGAWSIFKDLAMVRSAGSEGGVTCPLPDCAGRVCTFIPAPAELRVACPT